MINKQLKAKQLFFSPRCLLSCRNYNDYHDVWVWLLLLLFVLKYTTFLLGNSYRYIFYFEN